MAKCKPRRLRPGRDLPPPLRLTPEEEAEDERLRVELIGHYERVDAILLEKIAEAEEWKRIREARLQAFSD